jgi:hypothetical protein
LVRRCGLVSVWSPKARTPPSPDTACRP